MKIITCTGYYATGSSAVTDFFGEFDNIVSLGESEFRFLHDPDGISNLETNIIDLPNRHNTSQAIKRFIKYSKFENGNFLSKRYRKYFGENYKKLTEEYVNSIVKLKANTSWRYDKIEKGDFFYMIDTFLGLVIGRITKKVCGSVLPFLGEQGYYTDISREVFYERTRNYTKKLFESANIDADCDYLMVDQLVPPSNISRYINYVENMLVIVVDRDPRDVYTREKTLSINYVIPQNDVKSFCSWYKITRSHRYKEKYPSNVLFVQFEDLIYKYNETTAKLMDFVGVDEIHHTKIRKLLNPGKSIKGTQTWLNHPELKSEIDYIESELTEYLYNY